MTMRDIDVAEAFSVQIAQSSERGTKIGLMFYMLYDMLPKTVMEQQWRASEIDGNMTPFYIEEPVVPEVLELRARIETCVWSSIDGITMDVSKWKQSGIASIDAPIPRFFTASAAAEMP